MSHQNVEPIVRLCGGCLEETAIVGANYHIDRLVWVCPNCGRIELSDIWGEQTLREPTDTELHDILCSHNKLAEQVIMLQKQARLDQWYVEWMTPSELMARD